MKTVARDIYTSEYAKQYRACDEIVSEGGPVARLGNLLEKLSGQFDGKISVLDLGCGTGRYFWKLKNVAELVGVDRSAPMLAEARSPIESNRIVAERVILTEGDILSIDFEPARFDLIYSIGVLGEHVAFNGQIASRVFRWLKPQGLFLFTTVHPISHSVHRTFKRRAGEWLLPNAGGALRYWLRDRVLSGGCYADEEYIQDVLNACGFKIERLEQWPSDIHLQCHCVARKR